MPLLVELAVRDPAGVGYSLAQAVNRHSSWNARLIAEFPHPYGYPMDIVVRKGDHSEEIRELISSADYILFVGSCYDYRPLGLRLPRDTPRGIWHVGSAYRQGWKFYNEHVHPGMKHVFVTEAARALYKKAHILRNPYDCENQPLVEKDWSGPLLVGHSPSNPSIKGTEHFTRAVARLCKRHPNVHPIMIEGADNRTCVELKKPLHIFFDQILNVKMPEGYLREYGVSLIEAGCFGAACLAAVDLRPTPIIDVRNEDDIVEAVERLYRDRGELEELALETREYLTLRHSYRVIANDFLQVIER